MKRAAVAEVQKAMALAEKRALDSVAEERVKMERILIETNNNNNNNNKFNSDSVGQPDNTQTKDQVTRHFFVSFASCHKVAVAKACLVALSKPR